MASHPTMASRRLVLPISGALLVALTATIAGSDRLRAGATGFDRAVDWLSSATGGAYPVRFSLATPRAIASQPAPANPAPTASAPAAIVAMRLPVAADRVAVSEGPTQPQTPGAAAKGGPFLRVNFNLAPASKEDAIYVSKQVVLDGAEAVAVKMKITGGARIAILGQDIAARVGRNLSAAGDEAGYVDVSKLRALGLGVRYDAAKDRVQISSAAN